MAEKSRFDWHKPKQKILRIIKSASSEETKQAQIETLLKTLPFGSRLVNYHISYNACGYPYWATHKTIRSDSFMLRDILDLDMDPETFETDYRCPCCRQFASHKT